ncbi:MAG: GntR family transcriptional regulator [Rhodobacteraceae bacterium]|nr:GntR family transcriptional regulator [Paracoccaceae bacterium]
MNVAKFLDPNSWIDGSIGPLYVRLRKRIEDGIESGVLEPNTPLPPEREIASLTALSRVTVRKAIEELVDRGVIVQIQGSGSFVTEKKARVEQSLSRLTSFTEDMERRGMASESKWLERGIFIPSPDEVVVLALGASDSVSRITRLRIAGDRPMALERASLPLDILPNPTAVEKSLYEVLQASGNLPVRAIQKISAINLDEKDAELLGVPENSAGLHIERTSYLSSGRVAEFTRSKYRGDAYDFVAELRLATN